MRWRRGDLVCAWIRAGPQRTLRSATLRRWLGAKENRFAVALHPFKRRQLHAGSHDRDPLYRPSSLDSGEKPTPWALTCQLGVPRGRVEFSDRVPGDRHFRFPPNSAVALPLSDVDGLSSIRIAGLPIDGSTGALRWNKQILENGGKYSGIASIQDSETNQQLDSEQIARL